jgi:hypothetical protein
MTKGPITSLTLDTHVRCLQVYPPEGADPTLASLKTVGIKLSKNQAIDLARVLLAAAHEWNELELVAYRGEKRKSDATYRLSVVAQHYGLEEGLNPEAIKHPVPKGKDMPPEIEDVVESLKDSPLSD